MVYGLRTSPFKGEFNAYRTFTTEPIPAEIRRVEDISQEEFDRLPLKTRETARQRLSSAMEIVQKLKTAKEGEKEELKTSLEDHKKWFSNLNLDCQHVSKK